MTRTLIVLLALVAIACGSSNTDLQRASAAAPTSTVVETTSTVSDTTTVVPSTTPATSTTQPALDRPPTKTGATVLVESEFAQIDGKRVGLIAHQSSVVDGKHLGDLLNAAPNVELVAMFGPEHGVRGSADAGEHVKDAVDATTGVPVFSLFGPTRQPTPEMLDGVDVLVYDLQDVGTRYYTYISTMGLAMQAAAAANIEFLVLDRPNPLGDLIDGGLLDIDRTSFVGQYPVSDTYGLTAFELARLIQAEALLPGLESLDLDGVQLTGWDSTMRWEDTGLEWIPPSPAITTPDTALLYPSTIYFEATNLSYGRGTDTPFEIIGAPWLDADALRAELESRDLPGVEFVATTIAPAMLPGMSVAPAYLGETIPAVRLMVTNAAHIRPATAGVHLLDAVFAQARDAGVDPLDRPEWLDQLSGSDLLRRSLAGNEFTVAEVLNTHETERVIIESMLAQMRLYSD